MIMSWIELAAIALFVVASTASAAAAAGEQPASWIVWSDDGADYPAPLASDIKWVRVGTAPAQLHIDFLTYEAPAGAPISVPVASEVGFNAFQGVPLPVKFSWDMQPRLQVDGRDVTTGWSVADGSKPTSWHLQLDWTTLGVSPASSFALRDLTATTTSGVPMDEATGPDLEFTTDTAGRVTVSIASLEAGVTVEGVDFAGGTSVTVDARGAPIVAYYVYDGERGAERGIYLAHLDGKTLVPQRIGDVAVTRDNGRDDQMRTQVAHDGAVTFVLFTDDPAVDNDEDGPGHLGTPDSVYVLASDNGWAREDPTPGGRSDVGPEDVADLAARNGKVVAAVPVGNDVWVVERTSPGAWRQLTILEGANNAKLALDSKGNVHVAYVVYGADASQRDGVLYLASSPGFTATKVGENIDAGWESPETDGSFAIAVGPQDEVALLWDDGRARERTEEQKVAILQDGKWTHDFAPLVPGHGNPQYTMRLGYTAQGHLVAASGYGGTDTLAVRGPNGGWIKSELPRYDVWDMAVTSAGQVYFAYTQPHGGTTVALTAYAVSPQFAQPQDAELAAALAGPKSNPAPGLSIVALLALVAVVAIVGQRRD